jgi:hypothetical protein
MAAQNIPHRTSNSNTTRQAHLAEALRIAQERLAALQANAPQVTEIHYTTDPGPDFTPRRYGWLG